jgi:hypothetical protein
MDRQHSNRWEPLYYRYMLYGTYSCFVSCAVILKYVVIGQLEVVKGTLCITVVQGISLKPLLSIECPQLVLLIARDGLSQPTLVLRAAERLRCRNAN